MVQSYDKVEYPFLDEELGKMVANADQKYVLDRLLEISETPSAAIQSFDAVYGESKNTYTSFQQVSKTVYRTLLTAGVAAASVNYVQDFSDAYLNCMAIVALTGGLVAKVTHDANRKVQQKMTGLVSNIIAEKRIRDTFHI